LAGDNAKTELLDRLPLVIGVTGHRDLREEDIPDLEREVAAVIERLKQDYLASRSASCRLCRWLRLARLCRWMGLSCESETPLIVLSSLAEGADQLVARVAMKHGARLIAALPMPRDEYRRDFEPGIKPGAAAEYDKLLAAAGDDVWEVPFAPGNSVAAVRHHKDQRDRQYREVGIFIVRHCQVLIALWDGNEKDMSVGGTAEVVSFKRDGIPLEVTGSARASLDASEIGPIVHVVTPRAKWKGRAFIPARGVWPPSSCTRISLTKAGTVRRPNRNDLSVQSRDRAACTCRRQDGDADNQPGLSV
jgi:hypothetical protein